ncbi:GNAT family N-acetyltransferase [Jannaschia seohaensis]|uniref:GNAT family N-acetyltransferase n=1 Tax=Jannaschia seohaensis TaxID=475081 RepID=UPI0014754931|nr:GNAT family N-acetyltransferase [Jannaschia seohaensis]
MSSEVIRTPVPEDAAAISEIHAQGLATGHASFSDKPHDWTSFSASYMKGCGLALITEDRNVPAAWAGVASTSTRMTYRGVGEISVYVSNDQRRSGLGRQLLQEMISTSEKAGYWTLVAQVFPENTASLALHSKMGFSVVGRRAMLGLMSYGPCAGQWRDVIMMERRSDLVGR